MRVPADRILGGEGQAFAIAQTRLGGGRIHHAMRTIALLHKAFDMMLERAVSRQTARGPLASLQLAQQRIAESWIEIEQFRLLVLRTWLIDKPKGLHDVAQRAMHLHGALGISNEMPFTEMIVESEVMALADGRTEVHPSRSPASTRNRIHEIDTTDLVTVESALDRSGRLATC